MDDHYHISRNAITLEIGGTFIKSAIVNDGVLIHFKETPAEAHKGGPHVLSLCEDIIRSYFSFGPVDCIGISTAGLVNPEEGIVVYSQNIPSYNGARVKSLFEDIFGLPVAVENDVNALAIGESLYGAGREENDFICLTYGTGIGGAIVINKQLYRGHGFSAGEFGGMLVHPEHHRPDIDRNSGCYEAYASVSALVQKARHLDSSLRDGRTIFARREEPRVASLINEWIREISYGLISIIHMFNPSCLLLGGGVMEQECLIPLIQECVFPSLIPGFESVRIKKAALPIGAGLLGAGYLASQLVKH